MQALLCLKEGIQSNFTQEKQVIVSISVVPLPDSIILLIHNEGWSCSNLHLLLKYISTLIHL